MCPRIAADGAPAPSPYTTRPRDARARPDASRRSVVLPAPFGPKMPVRLPARQAKETFDRTRERP